MPRFLGRNFRPGQSVTVRIKDVPDLEAEGWLFSPDYLEHADYGPRWSIPLASIDVRDFIGKTFTGYMDIASGGLVCNLSDIRLTLHESLCTIPDAREDSIRFHNDQIEKPTYVFIKTPNTWPEACRGWRYDYFSFSKPVCVRPVDPYNFEYRGNMYPTSIIEKVTGRKAKAKSKDKISKQNLGDGIVVKLKNKKTLIFNGAINELNRSQILELLHFLLKEYDYLEDIT